MKNNLTNLEKALITFGHTPSRAHNILNFIKAALGFGIAVFIIWKYL